MHVCEKNGVGKHDLQIIIESKYLCFRKLVQSSDLFEVCDMLTTRLIGLANLYTGVVIDKENIDGHLVVSDAALEEYSHYSQWVIKMFPTLSLNEISMAFEMAAAKKLKDEKGKVISLKTYFGKFHADMLGDILSSYKDWRDAVYFQYDKSKTLIDEKSKEPTEEEKIRLNQEAAKVIIQEYNELKDRVANGYKVDIDNDIKRYWAKTLVSNGIINFSKEKKAKIYQTAKDDVLVQYKFSLTDKSKTIHQLQNIKTVIKKISNGQEDQTYKDKCHNRYSKLLIYESLKK